MIIFLPFFELLLSNYAYICVVDFSKDANKRISIGDEPHFSACESDKLQKMKI